MKYLLPLVIVLLFAGTTNVIAQDAMYSKQVYMEKLESVNEVMITMAGWDYKYSGNWMNSMSIENGHTLTFSRGKVTHSYDLRKVTFLQEEGKYVKLWFR